MAAKDMIDVSLFGIRQRPLADVLRHLQPQLGAPLEKAADPERGPFKRLDSPIHGAGCFRHHRVAGKKGIELVAVHVEGGLDEAHIIAHLARALMTSTDRVYGLPQTLGHIHRIASLTRDRLSLEAWRTLNAFYVGRHWQSGAMPT
ncbi:MAG: alpha-E domain-containing protein, partial [Nitrospira sp.]